MTDHASDEYLDGLSDLDRARAIVAVRWCGAEWRNDRERRVLTDHFALYKISDPSIPLFGHRPWLQLIKTDCRSWGTNWRGTASLMELAERKGWRLTRVEGMPVTATLLSISGVECHEGTSTTIHAAVLLACAAAAQKEGA